MTMLCVNGICPGCAAGEIGIRRCSDGVTCVLMCDECDLVWLRPDELTIEASLAPSMASFEVARTGLAVGGGAAGWASRDDVERAGWLGYVTRERV